MTRVIFFSRDGYGMGVRVEGHSGFDRAGQDTVCAGVSMLIWTLIDMLEDEPEFYASIRVDETAPLIEVACSPDEEAEGRCTYLYEVIYTGMARMAASYPQHVELRRETDGDN